MCANGVWSDVRWYLSKAAALVASSEATMAPVNFIVLYFLISGNDGEE
jgi:hypothetical protein